MLTLGLGSIALGMSSSCVAQSDPQRPIAFPWGWNLVPSIAVVSIEGDPRLPLVGDAVAFWNSTFLELGTRFRLGAMMAAWGHEQTRMPCREPRRARLLHPRQRTRGRERAVTQTSDYVTAAQRGRRSLQSVTLEPSLNLWTANPLTHELDDNLDVHVVSEMSDICVPADRMSATEEVGAKRSVVLNALHMRP